MMVFDLLVFILKQWNKSDVSKVVPVDKCSLVITIILAALFLGEAFTWKTFIGSLMIVGGTMIMIL